MGHVELYQIVFEAWISERHKGFGLVQSETLQYTNIFFNNALAGSAGFEPANDGTKTRCLTAWRRPIGELGVLDQV